MNPKIYKAVCDTFGTPKIDSLASRINRQTEKYFSWKPEPEAFAVDLFSINLSYYFMFIFPPFSLLTKVIKKICRHQATYRNCSFSSVVKRAFVSADIGAIRLSFTKNLAKSNKFDIATWQSSCSSLSRKSDSAHNKVQHYGGLNVSDTTNSILVASLRELTREKYNTYLQKWHIYCQETNYVTSNIQNQKEN